MRSLVRSQRRRAKVIALGNQKGGCGKTTTTRNLGKALHLRGYKVLYADLDQQGNLTEYCGVKPDNLERSIYNVFASYIDIYEEPISVRGFIYEIELGLDLLPANEELAALDIDLINAPERERILTNILEPLLDEYDYILIDCPPALSLMVVNALVAADALIITLQVDFLATRGVRRLLKLTGGVQRKLNPDLIVDGIVLTMADMRTSHTKAIIKQTRERFLGEVHVFESITKMYTGMKDSTIVAKSILEIDPKSPSAESFRALAEELEALDGKN